MMMNDDARGGAWVYAIAIPQTEHTSWSMTRKKTNGKRGLGELGSAYNQEPQSDSYNFHAPS